MAKKTDNQPPEPSETVAQAEPTETEQLAALQADLQDRISVVQGKITELQQMEYQLTRELDRTVSRLSQVQSVDSNQANIAAFLRQQHANRIDNQARLQDLLSAGVQPGELAPRRSPLDQAIAAKRPRGHSGLRS